MAETVPQDQNRQIVIIATVIAVVFFTFFLVGLRSCSSSTSNEKETPQPKLSSDVTIYSNLDLKDAAAVITRLKEIKIPYQIKDEGRAISVPRGRADEARLGLAEKNLPAGGTVGWEIFDQSKLGATDFDRRIQFIRAISGELARTINRISAIEDTRVQLVIPETRLFEVAQAPVTASVLLKMKPGESLSAGQISGIVNLIARSVENLNPQNITIIDTNGNILSGGGYTPKPAQKPAAEVQPRSVPTERPQVVLENKAEEGVALEVQAKLELEDKLTNKVQSLLNKMYPPNITVAKVNVDSIKNIKTTVIILINKDFKLNPALKRSTFDTVSAAVGYDKARGDKIILTSVKFRTMVAPSSAKPAETASIFSLATLKALYRKMGRGSAITIAVLFLIMIFLFSTMFRGGKKAAQAPSAPQGAPAEAVKEEAPPAREAAEQVPVVEQMKSLATQNPQQVAQLLKMWESEEGA